MAKVTSDLHDALADVAAAHAAMHTDVDLTVEATHSERERATGAHSLVGRIAADPGDAGPAGARGGARDRADNDR